MEAETYSAPVVSRFVVPSTLSFPVGYYRSKLFIASSTSNPLVAAAGPLLSLLERLSVSPTLPSIASIRDNIEHELHAFHSKLISQQYANELIVIANYLLRATIDELLGKSYIRLNGQPAKFTAFTPFSFDEKGPQSRFFDVLNHIKQQANQYLDLLELAYYCLIAGFEGEQHLQPNGRQTLDNLIEEIYQLIEQHRVNKSHQLFTEKTKSIPQVVSHKPIIAAVIIAVTLLTVLYFTSHSILENKAKNVLYGQTVLARLEN